MKLTGKNRSSRGRTCPSATLSSTNPTWTDPGSNPGLRGGRPAANRLSHGTAVSVALVIQHAKHMRHIIVSSVAFLFVPHFSTLSYKRHDLRRNFVQHKMCLVFCTSLSETFPALKKNSARCYHKCTQVFT
jgi:hypothetical protein